MQKLSSSKYIKYLLILFWMVWILASIINTSHPSFNIEPYPDTIFYLETARSFARGNGLWFPNLSEFKPAIFPLYSLLIGVVYLIGLQPMGFVVLNTCLGALGLWIFWLLTNDLKQSERIAALILFLSHAIWWWLPTLALSENLLWVTILCCLYYFKQYRQSLQKKYLVAMGLAGVIVSFTKFSAVPIGVGIMCIALWYGLKRYRFWHITIGFSSLLLAVSWLFRNQIDSLLRLLIFGQYDFFNFSYLLPNALSYTLLLLGKSNQFLWQPIIFLTPILGITTALLSFQMRKKYPYLPTFLLIAALHLPLILVFYDVNTRYIISLLPILILAQVFGLMYVTQKFSALSTKLHLVPSQLVLALAGVTLIFQAPFLILLAKQTVLRTGKPWQYLAVQHIYDTLAHSNQNVVIATALPPQIFSLYTYNDKLSIVPISTHQEFLDKKIMVWQNVLPSDEPSTMLEHLLRTGRRVYISNAYITHNRQVIEDYEYLKQLFTTKLVSTGCNNACDIYELFLK